MKVIFFAFLIFMSTSVLYGEEGEFDFIDYSLLTHKISLEMIRAGNNDKDGTNDYYFSVKMTGFRNSKDDFGKEIKERKHIDLDLGIFGQITLESLTYWLKDKKNKEDKIFSIDGDSIRKLVSSCMNEFKVNESEIGVVVNISMWEKNKTLMFFGKDTFISKVIYFPIPSTIYQAKSRTNLDLTLQGEKGSEVNIKIIYDHPIEVNKHNQ